MANPANHGAAAAAPFLPCGKICRLRDGKEAGVIAWREYGLYERAAFSRFREGELALPEPLLSLLTENGLYWPQNGLPIAESV